MTVQRDGNRTTMIAEGRIDTYTAPQFAAEIEKTLPGTTDLTLDFLKSHLHVGGGVHFTQLLSHTGAV